MNPSLPLNGNPPHAAQMPVLPRRAASAAVAVDDRSRANRWIASVSKGRFADPTLTMLLVLIGAALGLTAVFVVRY